MSRTSRLLGLITMLRARRTPVTADALARETGVSPRSVYRDIETLRSLGAPLDGQAGLVTCCEPAFSFLSWPSLQTKWTRWFLVWVGCSSGPTQIWLALPSAPWPRYSPPGWPILPPA